MMYDDYNYVATITGDPPVKFVSLFKLLYYIWNKEVKK